MPLLTELNQFGGCFSNRLHRWRFQFYLRSAISGHCSFLRRFVHAASGVSGSTSAWRAASSAVMTLRPPSVPTSRWVPLTLRNRPCARSRRNRRGDGTGSPPLCFVGADFGPGLPPQVAVAQAVDRVFAPAGRRRPGRVVSLQGLSARWRRPSRTTGRQRPSLLQPAGVLFDTLARGFVMAQRAAQTQPVETRQNACYRSAESVKKGWRDGRERRGQLNGWDRRIWWV